jgi:hypothetical protein
MTGLSTYSGPESEGFHEYERVRSFFIPEFVAF